jgi:hypothetical protein
LNGAVNAIVALEKDTAPGASFNGEIRMSQMIEAQFQKPWLNWKRGSYNGVIAFYVIVFLLLLAGDWFTRR